ncbi:hypothetical protein C8R43DRAFT_960774 [Mycena crocata]|nr:hypothetical protein C8R43DRAFT_960774 [Mycena crocata]
MSNPTIPLETNILGHSRIDSSIWSVYNGDPAVLLNMPTPSERPPPYHASVKGNFWTPSYVSLATPFIIFIPACFPWYGPLFGRLNYKRATLPITLQEDGWGLREAEQEVWDSLEIELRRALRGLMEMSNLPRPKYMVPFGFPYRFGYQRKWDTQQQARNAAFRSIHGFLPLIGNLAMKGLSDNYGLHQQWIANLEASVVGDERIPRIGGFVDFTVPPGEPPSLLTSSTELDFLIGSIIKSQLPIPLYIAWGDLDGHPKIFIPHTLRELQFVPDFLEVEYLQDHKCRDPDNIQLPGQPPLYPSAPATTATTSPPPIDLPIERPEPFPPVERGSQQRECETMEEFFARRQKANRDRASRETFEETKTREQREAHASKGAVPGKKGARVFTWEKTNGYYIRRAAGRSKYEDVWEEYGPRQRRYDSFYNEWDVCEEFGPADDGAESDDGDYDDIPMGPHPRDFPPPAPAPAKLLSHTAAADALLDPCFRDSPLSPTPVRAATDDDDHDDIDDDLPDMLPVDAELEEGMIFEPGKSSVVDLAHAHQLSELASETDSVVEYASIAPSFKEIVYLRFGCTVTKENVQNELELLPPIVVKKISGQY